MTTQKLPSTYKAVRAAPDKDKDPIIDEVPLKMPGRDQVLVKIAYSPLNPTDLLSGKRQVPGYSQDGELIGSEGSGTIVAVGDDLKVPHKVGDRVHVIGPGCLGLGDGCWAEYVLKDSESCSPIMEGLSLQEAASHWINPGTAYMMAKIVKDGNHKAAIHTAGTSALGKMMIRYFKQQGITLINIVRREEAIDELKREGADYALNSKDPDFDKRLKEVCEKTQATCAFDAIGGDFTNRLLKCMPRKSTVYVYGVLSGGTGVDNLEWVELVKEKCVTSLLIYNYTNEMRSKGQLSKFFNEIHSLLPTVFKSQVLQIFRLDQLPEAIAYYKDNSSKGKILIQP